MLCNRVRKELPLLVDHPGEVKPEVAAHLSSCDSCRREFAFLQKMTDALRTAETVQAPAGFSAGVMARISADVPAAGRRWTERFSRWKQLVAAAATLLLIAGSTLAMVLSGGAPAPHVATKSPTGSVVSPVNPAENQPSTGEVVPTPPKSSGDTVNKNSTPGPTVPETPENSSASERVTPTSRPQPNEPPSQIAEARPVRAFLSQQRLLTSTELRIQVQDLEAATANAVATARSWGAAHKYTVTASEGAPRIQILQFTIDKENKDGFLIVLGGLGTVIDRNDNAVDQTETFNKQKAEYETLVAVRNEASEDERAAIDTKLNELEKWLAEIDALAGKHTVTLCLVE